MSSLSGLQRDVLKLYRTLLRTAKNKAGVTHSPLEKLGKLTVFVGTSHAPHKLTRMLLTVQRKFREEAHSVHRHDWQIIEHMIRQGYKQKKVMEMPGFSAASIKTYDHWWYTVPNAFRDAKVCILLCFWSSSCKSSPPLRTNIIQCLSTDNNRLFNHKVRYSRYSYLMAANWSLIFPKPSIIVSNASRLSSNCTCRVSGRAFVEEGASSTWRDIRILGIWMSESYKWRCWLNTVQRDNIE